MIALYCLLAVTVGYYVIITFIKIFICNPVSAYWQESQRDTATCLSQPGVIIADSVISFLTDIAIFAFPVALTWSLQMPIWKKIRVIFLLGLGGIAVAFSLFRLVIGVHERRQPHETTMFMKSILTACVMISFGIARNLSNTFSGTRRLVSVLYAPVSPPSTFSQHIISSVPPKPEEYSLAGRKTPNPRTAYSKAINFRERNSAV